MKSLVTSCDLLGGQVYLLHNNKRTVKSLFGGLISIFLVVSFSLLTLGFGQDFFYRTNPSFIKQDFNPPNPNSKNITQNELMLTFRYENSDGKFINIDGLSYYFKAYRKKYLRDEKGLWVSTRKELMKYSQCQKSDFPENLHAIYDEKGMGSFYCIQTNSSDPLQIGGLWEDSFVNYLQIEYHICNEGEINPYSKKPCNKKEISDKYMKDLLYVSFLFQDLYIDPSNFDKPILKTVFNYYHILDALLTKSSYIYFADNIVESDIGWILKENVYSSEFKFYDWRVDVLTRLPDDKGVLPTGLGMAKIYIHKKIEKYTRLYVKIQTLAANVGGILKSFTFFATLIVQTINQFKLDYEMTSCNQILKCFKEEHKEFQEIKGQKTIKDIRLTSKTPIEVSKFTKDNNLNNQSQLNQSKKNINEEAKHQNIINIIIANIDSKKSQNSNTNGPPFLNSFKSYLKFKMLFYCYSKPLKEMFKKLNIILYKHLNIVALIGLHDKVNTIQDITDKK